MFLASISVHDAGDVGDGDKVGGAAEDAVGDGMHGMHRSALGSLHVEVGLAVLGLFFLLPFVLEFYTARADDEPVE